MKDRICTKCKLVLQESIYDKCMYCGEPVQEIFQLSEIKKDKIRSEQEKRIEEGKKTSKKYKDASKNEGRCGGGTCGGGCGGGCGG